jgi:hypothetical protein
MRTLVQSSALYRSQGVKPRVFVRIANSNDTTLLLQGTKTVVSGTDSYEDRIETFGAINQSIEPAGGMAEVSGASVSGIILDQRLTLCTEASISPYVSGVVMGAGRLLKQGLPAASYVSVRNSTDATDYQTPALVVGRYNNVGGNYYSVWRAPLEFKISAGMTSCEDAFIQLTGMSDSADTAFTIIGVAGTWTAPITAADFNNFTGWQASGDYTSFITNLIESWTTAEYGTTVYLRLNTAGRAAVLAATGGYFKLMLLSNKDTTNAAAPTGAEYVQFESSTALLKLRYNSITLDNQDTEILLGLETLPATINRTTIDSVYEGVVDSYQIGDKLHDLILKQNDHKKNCMIPDGVIDGTGIYATCDKSIIGETVPVLYGDFISESKHRGGLASFLNGTTPANRYGNAIEFAKAYIYDFSDKTNLRAIVAGHNVKATDFFAAVYEQGIESFVALAGDVTDVLSGSDKTGKIDIADGIITDFPYNRVTNSSNSDTNIQPLLARIPYLNDNSVGCLNPEYAIDDIYDNWTNLSTNGAWGIYQFYMSYGVSSLFDDLVTCLETYAPNGYGSGFCRVYVTFYDDNYDTHVDTYDYNTDGQHIHDVASSVLSSGVVKARFTISAYNTPGDGSKPVYFRNLCIIRGYSRDIVNEVFIRAKGRMYGSWIDAVGRTGSYNEGDLIENPAHVIESVARDEMGLVTTAGPPAIYEIDTDAFDAAATARTGDKFAFQLLERTPARELLNDLAYQGRMFLWWDEQDRLTVKAINLAAYFPNSGTDIPGAWDIFTTTGDPANGSFTHHPIISSGDDFITRMDMADCKNDFVIKYKQNYATGDFAEVLTCNKDGNNLTDAYLTDYTATELQALCTASETALLTRNTLTVEAYALRDESTANRLMEHLVVWLSKRRYIIRFMAGISALIFEPGDFINVRDDRIYDLFGTAVTERKKWMCSKINPRLDNCTIDIEAIEV